jgi:lysine biosynthesis protein LysW
MGRGGASVKRAANKISGDCPECKGKISLYPAKVGQFLTRPHCDVHLEVIGVDPLEFDWGYDWTWQGENEEPEGQGTPIL